MRNYVELRKVFTNKKNIKPRLFDSKGIATSFLFVFKEHSTTRNSDWLGEIIGMTGKDSCRIFLNNIFDIHKRHNNSSYTEKEISQEIYDLRMLFRYAEEYDDFVWS